MYVTYPTFAPNLRQTDMDDYEIGDILPTPHLDVMGGPTIFNSELYRELEDRIAVLEEALVEADRDLLKSEIRIDVLLEIARKAHELSNQLDNAMRYRDQPELPFGDTPT